MILNKSNQWAYTGVVMVGVGPVMMSVEQSIANMLAQIAAVESVHVSQDGDVYRVFTVTADEDEDAFQRIYDEERVSIRRFQDLHFDFNVVARRGRPLDERLTFTAPTWQRSGGDAPCPTEYSIS